MSNSGARCFVRIEFFVIPSYTGLPWSFAKIHMGQTK